MSSDKGKWVTVRGRRIFIPEGQTLEQAISANNSSQGGKATGSKGSQEDLQKYLDDENGFDNLLYDLGKDEATGLSYGDFDSDLQEIMEDDSVDFNERLANLKSYLREEEISLSSPKAKKLITFCKLRFKEE